MGSYADNISSYLIDEGMEEYDYDSKETRERYNAVKKENLNRALYKKLINERYNIKELKKDARIMNKLREEQEAREKRESGDSFDPRKNK